MSYEILVEIIEICLSIEHQAEKIYLRLAEQTKDKKLRAFWEKMSSQETMHAEYWEKLLKMAWEDAIPQVFERPTEIRDDLEAVREKVRALEKKVLKKSNLSTAFLLAYRLEFYLLNPSISTLFHFLRTASGEKSLVDIYDDHLSGFISMLNEYGKVSPALELLGETIHRLWSENRNLTTQNHVDSLTGVLNRRGFDRTVTPMAYLAKRHGARVGVLMIDIDDFKTVNRERGHHRGDDAIRSVAGIIKSSLRKSDIVGRYGGEEFLAFLSPVEPEALRKVADTIRRRVQKETRRRIPVTVSIGATEGSFCKNVEAEVQKLIRRADARMRKAKAAGKNQVNAG